MGAVLSSNEIRALIESENPLFSDFSDLEQQVQANGFDLTLAEVRRFTGAGTIGIDNADRVLPELELMEPDERGFLALAPGAYHITYAETVSLPKDLMALGRPRSSLTRSGVSIHTAVWDAGYSGRSTSLMVIYNAGRLSPCRSARGWRNWYSFSYRRRMTLGTRASTRARIGRRESAVIPDIGRPSYWSFGRA